MKQIKLLLGLLLGISTFLLLQPAWSADPVEEARAVFVKLVDAAKAGDMDAFKSHIVAEDLAEMEKDGATQFMMMMMAEEDPTLFQGEAAGDHIVFVHEIKEEGPEGSSTSKSTVHMMNVDGEWKFGKPREVD